ncbi:MAG TPA: hypothetical protein VF593_07885 [Chthoniobacteraceae bacterium]
MKSLLLLFAAVALFACDRKATSPTTASTPVRSGNTTGSAPETGSQVTGGAGGSYPSQPANEYTRENPPTQR